MASRSSRGGTSPTSTTAWASVVGRHDAGVAEQEQKGAPRRLASDEEAVLIALIEQGVCLDEDVVVTETDRAGWRAQVAQTRAGRRCGCGSCPSVDLTDLAGVTPDRQDSRVVIEAGTTDALLLLFIDDGRLSYLELAPLDEESHHRFPDPQHLQFPG